MSKRTACALYFAVLALPALAQTGAPPSSAEPGQEAHPAAAAAAPELAEAPTQIVVSGRRPGPGVWKVSKGEHVMWVFGIYSPLPAKMEWDASRVERLVAGSQEVLTPPGANGHVGFFRGITLLPSLVGLKKNPDGAQLRDVVPADVYARWTGLKEKYLGDDDGVERYRPIFAGQELRQAGMKKNGLATSVQVVKAIEDIARKNKVKVSKTGFEFDVEEPRKMIQEFKKQQMDDVACFTKTLDSIDGDLDAMRARANAWANGNIAEIRSVNFTEREDACNNAILNSSVARNNAQFQDMPGRLRAAWLQSAEKSLAGNASTFAILQMKDILGERGYLADLAAKGYTVESPR
ncbi:TraB/GumN family protein [Massilia sp. TN1-12]|uniref:TraB/GumN family protein n=1 Tax=Massilia paldalensis TaxID=3377675 RepID=UPI0038515CBE